MTVSVPKEDKSRQENGCYLIGQYKTCEFYCLIKMTLFNLVCVSVLILFCSCFGLGGWKTKTAKVISE